ncbi:hypothetical protein MW887_007087 [Aspergillus wentii]|nr:hypothetical protein MW887_007087 [Aspergillus wentii]
MTSEDEDPLDWTIDEVVEFLCHNPLTPWSQSAAQAPRPDPVTFETAIRANLLTGEVLLHDVDKETLREDLGLKALGHRSSMLMAIRYLRQNSPKYQMSLGKAGLNDNLSSIYASSYFAPTTPGQGPAPELSSPVYPRPVSEAATPQNLLNSRLITPSVSGVHNSKRPIRADPPSFNPVQKEKDNVSSQVPNTMETSAAYDNIERHQSVPPGSPRIRSESHAEFSEISGRVRSLEHHIIDQSGRKRRKLDLRSVAEASGEKSILALTTSASQAKHWYMGPERIAPSQLFYGPNSEEDDHSFVMLGSEFPSAQRAYVKSCMQYFYQQKPIKLRDGHGDKWAVIPYKASEVNPSKSRLFSLYTLRNGKVTVSKENLENWPQLHQSQAAYTATSSRTSKASDPFAYLIEKYPVLEDNENTYPLYGDSGSEGEYDEDTWQEIDDEQQDPAQNKPINLTSGEIDSVIAQCVTDYKNKWHQDKKPKEEQKARLLWLRARRGKLTNQQIKGSLREASRLEERLKKIKKAILESEVLTRAGLQALCVGMEQTVHDIEKQKWRVKILEQPVCPPKVAAGPKPKPISKPRNGDEESLHSESDYESEDPLADFIDNSDDMTGPASPEQHIATQSETPSSTDSDEDAVISPSGLRRKSRAQKRAPFRTDSPSPRVSVNEKEPEYVDLTIDSADEFRIETPPLNPVQSRVSQSVDTPYKSERDSISPGPNLTPDDSVETRNQNNQTPKDTKGSKLKYKPKQRNLPEFKDFDKISSISWEELEERMDRRRLLAKLIYSLSDEERKAMAKEVPAYDVSELKGLVEAALRALFEGKQEIDGVSQDENDIIMRTATFYISWINCAYNGGEGIRRFMVIKAENDLANFPRFFDEIRAHLTAYRSWDRERRAAAAAENPDNSNAEDTDLAPDDTPHKKRKKEVQESQDAKRIQQSAQARVALQNTQRKNLEKKMESMGFDNDDPDLQAVSFEEPVIYLDRHIGRRVKPHQLNGIQFMWRELIQDEKRQGCLLAHTMGLGKTMQVISLLGTISAAANSDDHLIRKQVPKRLRRSQTLVLCPSSLIENWYEEFLMWTPESNNIGPLRKITGLHKLHERLKEASNWNEEGGILIMSYDIFRALILNKATKTRGKALDEDDHKRVKEWLLDGPNIVVADEAHKMKNLRTGISQAASQFRTKSRIALTGSPLANNLEDYFTMVNWIAEDYLGDFVQFKANYVEPIEEGLYADSSHSERRRSLIKLQVLKEILEPKINRADISVLTGSLPPKVEFVITVPLTELQERAYNSYVETVLFQGKSDIGNARLWSWLAILALCCNHPASFKDKLLSRATEAARTGRKSNEPDDMPGDESIAQAGLPDSDKLVYQQQQIFDTVSDIQAIDLSYRSEILDKIVEESVKAGDKVLIFSHSLPTLNYVESMLKRSKRKYCRLDGTTPIFTRQSATKNFNSGSVDQVYLISTRAGGLGLNIPGANRVVIFDFGFNPVWEEQAVGRAYRLGQQKPVFVYRFIAGGTFEEVMYNKAVFKTQLAFRVVDKKNPVRWASRNAGMYLFPVKSIKQEDVFEYLGKDPHVLDKIIANDLAGKKIIRKIGLTETFQKEDNDKLTDEEKRGVQVELDDERLKRTDPEAYQKRVMERLAAANPGQVPAASQFGHNRPAPPFPYHPHQAYMMGRPSAANAPPLGPPGPNSNVFSSRNQTPHAAVSNDQNSRHAQSEPRQQAPQKPLPRNPSLQTDGPAQENSPIDNAQQKDKNTDKERRSESRQRGDVEKTSCKPQ